MCERQETYKDKLNSLSMWLEYVVAVLKWGTNFKARISLDFLVTN